MLINTRPVKWPHWIRMIQATQSIHEQISEQTSKQPMNKQVHNKWTNQYTSKLIQQTHNPPYPIAAALFFWVASQHTDRESPNAAKCFTPSKTSCESLQKDGWVVIRIFFFFTFFPFHNLFGDFLGGCLAVCCFSLCIDQGILRATKVC